MSEQVYTSKWPITFPTVDVIPEDILAGKILLARKHGKETWRMIGGFVDPSKNPMQGLEHNAARELEEEAGLRVSPAQMCYVGSFYVDDARYKDSPNGIITTVFVCHVDSKRYEPKANDDIAEAKWFDVKNLPAFDADHKEFLECYCKNIEV